MTSEQFRRARDLFEAALERRPEAVSEWLEAEERDPVVRREVESLLEHHSRAGEFLATPILEAAPHLLDDGALEPGAVVGSYSIIRELGRGGMGRVYLARDARLGRTVAIKMVAPALARDARFRERLRREARAAAALTHPGICTVYALEEADGVAFIVSEFVDGHPLRDEIGGARPSAAMILGTARDLASALGGAHEKGVIHRDLKPENVMRLGDGRVKILDFGLARISDEALPAATIEASAAGGLAGTPAYMAPEQIEGRAVTTATDVFAYGVLMYEWSTGVHPFRAATPLALVARIVESTPERLAGRADVPKLVGEVVDRCLRKLPAERFASAADLVAALNRPAEALEAAAVSANGTIWWRIHQLTAMTLYVIATARAWQIKEWLHTPVSLWAFILMGIAASVGGIVRGHLLFTDVVNRPRLGPELKRTRRAVLFADVLMAATLLADALALAQIQPLAAVLTICVAVGIALAAVLMEPATTSAVFGEL